MKIMNVDITAFKSVSTAVWQGAGHKWEQERVCWQGNLQGGQSPGWHRCGAVVRWWQRGSRWHRRSQRGGFVFLCRPHGTRTDVPPQLQYTCNKFFNFKWLCINCRCKWYLCNDGTRIAISRVARRRTLVLSAVERSSANLLAWRTLPIATPSATSVTTSNINFNPISSDCIKRPTGKTRWMIIWGMNVLRCPNFEISHKRIKSLPQFLFFLHLISQKNGLLHAISRCFIPHWHRFNTSCKQDGQLPLKTLYLL